MSARPDERRARRAAPGYLSCKHAYDHLDRCTRCRLTAETVYLAMRELAAEMNQEES